MNAPLSVLAFLFATVASYAEPIEREFFEVDGRPAFVILPDADKPKAGGAIPWVLYAPTFDKKLPSDKDEGWMIRRFLDAGIAVAGVDVGESYGSPAGQKTYNALYQKLVEERRFDPRACLLARSRGGLMLYCWAVNHPEKVRCVAAIYPVCDLSSYPGIDKASAAYGLTEEQLRDQLDDYNPIPRLAPLAEAGVPLFHIHGDKDKVVPLEANSGALVARYRELGGEAELVIAEGQWHNMWRGFFECEALVEFVIDNATGGDGAGNERPPERVITTQSGEGENTLTLRVEQPAGTEFDEVGKLFAAQFHGRYREMAELIGSDPGQLAPEVAVKFDEELKIPAYARGRLLVFSANWLRDNPQDAGGVFVHELAHIVQSYPGGNPGWLVEGVADYVRLKEEIDDTWRRNNGRHVTRMNFKSGYYPAAALLDYASGTYDEELVRKLNRAMKRRKLGDAPLKEHTGKGAEELWAEFLETKKG